MRAIVLALLLIAPVLAGPLPAGSDVGDVVPADGNVPPVADAGPDRTTEVGELLTFDASGSHDPDGSRAWRALAPMPAPRMTAAVAALGDAIYVMGGIYAEGGRFQFGFTDVWRYDVGAGAWVVRADLPKPLLYVCGGSWGGQVYLAGGESSPSLGVTGREAYVYDPGADTWKPIADAPLSVGCKDGQMVLAEDQFHIIESQCCNHIRYNPATDTWYSLVSSPPPNSDFALASDGQRIYKVGVHPSPAQAGKPGQLHVFDTATVFWEERAPPLVGVDSAGSFFLGGELHVLGGRQKTNLPQDHHQVYDPAADAWRSEDPLPTARYSFMTVAVGDFLYAMGGASISYLSTYDLVEAWGPWTDYAWDFGDGATALGRTVEHTYGSPGTYEVTLTVTDADGGVGVDTAIVTVGAAPLLADADCDPDTLNRKSNGLWVTCTVELPVGANPRAILPWTVRLGPVPAVVDLRYGFVRNGVADGDGDGVPERMFKFPRQALQGILDPGDREVTLTGNLIDGRTFEASVVFRVK